MSASAAPAAIAGAVSEQSCRGHTEPMERAFTVAQARQLMPQVRQRVGELIPVRASLAELTGGAGGAGRPQTGALAETKALEARLHEGLEWFAAQGLELKGIAPFLVDFPAQVAGRDVLLCWLEGEPALEWWHAPELGFMGRRPLDALEPI